MPVEKEEMYHLEIKYQCTMDTDDMELKYAYWNVPEE